MSADLLREAASKMRALAEAANRANPAPWAIDALPNYVDDHEVRDAGSISIAYSETGHNASMDLPTAGHVASWHPAVALAVADLLDAVAAENDSPEDGPLGFLNFACADERAAVRLATAYLGGDR